MGPTWVLSAPGVPHVGHMNLAIWDVSFKSLQLNENQVPVKEIYEYPLFK